MKHEDDINWWKEVCEEQRRALVTLNEMIGGKYSTTLENIRLVDRLEEQIEGLENDLTRKTEQVKMYIGLVAGLQKLIELRNDIFSQLEAQECGACGEGLTHLVVYDGLMFRQCDKCGSEIAGGYETRYNRLNKVVETHKEGL